LPGSVTHSPFRPSALHSALAPDPGLFASHSFNCWGFVWRWEQETVGAVHPRIPATLHPCNPASLQPCTPECNPAPPNEECRSLYYATLASAAGCCLKRIFVMLHCAARSCYCCCSSALSPKSFWLHLSNGSNALKYAKARKMFIISAVQTRAEDNGVEAE